MHEPQRNSRTCICSLSLPQAAVGIDDKLACDALVEVGIALGRVVEADHRRVDGFGDLDTVVQNRHHQAVVVLQYRCLAGKESMRLRPSQAKTQAEIAFLGRLVLRSRVFRYIESRNANSAGGACYRHQLIEDRGGLLLAAALP